MFKYLVTNNAQKVSEVSIHILLSENCTLISKCMNHDNNKHFKKESNI